LPTVVIVTIVVTIVLPLVAAVGVFGWAFWTYPHDRIELIDDPEVLEVITGPCDAMRVAASQIRLDDTATLAASLTTFATTARTIPEAVFALDRDVLDGDRPVASWADDWNSVLDAVDVHLASLRTDAPVPFVMPLTEDGYSVVDRMDVAGPDGCEVPAVLRQLTSGVTPP
jgi:hypothetical protein